MAYFIQVQERLQALKVKAPRKVALKRFYSTSGEWCTTETGSPSFMDMLC